MYSMHQARSWRAGNTCWPAKNIGKSQPGETDTIKQQHHCLVQLMGPTSAQALAQNFIHIKRPACACFVSAPVSTRSTTCPDLAIPLPGRPHPPRPRRLQHTRPGFCRTEITLPRAQLAATHLAGLCKTENHLANYLAPCPDSCNTPGLALA